MGTRRAEVPRSALFGHHRGVVAVDRNLRRGSRRLLTRLSYSAPIRLSGDMRRPDRTELEFTVLAFAALAPLGYYTLHWLFASVG